MLNIHLTLPIVVNLLRTIAQRDPERIGREEDGAGCTYATFKDGALTPICIVGQMFADLGLLRLLLYDSSDLNSTYHPSQYGACSVGFGFWDNLTAYGITAEHEAQVFMRDLQAKQDEGKTWGVAFAETVEEYLAVQNGKFDDEQAALDNRREALTSLFN